MNKQIEKISRLLPEKERVDVLEEIKAENASKMRERALQKNPELQARREESVKLLRRAKERAMKEFGIDSADLGQEAKGRNNSDLQDRAARAMGYKSGDAMVERGIVEQRTMIGRARAWFETTFGIKWTNEKDAKKKNVA